MSLTRPGRTFQHLLEECFQEVRLFNGDVLVLFRLQEDEDGQLYVPGWAATAAGLTQDGEWEVRQRPDGRIALKQRPVGQGKGTKGQVIPLTRH